MSTLLSQLIADDNYARAMAAQPCAEKRRAEANRKGAATRKKQAEARCGQAKTGLNDALRTRVPVGEANALNQTEIRALLADIDYSPNGLSGALTILFQASELCRSQAKPFRYYRKEDHATQV